MPYLDGLPPASSVNSSDIVAIDQGGTPGIAGTATTRRATIAQITAAAVIGGATLANISALRAATMAALPASLVYVTGYYAGADGGEGPFWLSADTTSADNGGTIIVDASGRRWYRETGSSPYSVIWFGAKGDSTTDDFTAIQAAIHTGKQVYLPVPSGANYKISASLVCDNAGQLITGAGTASIIATSSATAVIFNITANNVEIHSLALTSSVTRTAGGSNNYIDIVNVGYVHLHDMLMQNLTNGVRMAGSLVAGIRIHDITMDAMFGAGAGIEIGGGVDIVIRDTLLSGTGPSNQIASGVVITACGDVTLDHVSTVYCGNAISIAPATGAVIQTLFMNDCFFDSGSGAGIDVEATGTVQLLKIHNTWIASNASGGLILNTHGSGVIQQTDVINCVMSNNGAHGLIINTIGVTGTNIIGGSFGANTGSGIFVNASVTRFKIIGATCGISGEFVGNTQYGLSMGAGCDQFIVADNNFNGNGTGSVNWSSPGGTYGVTWRTHDNIGFPTAAFGILTTTAGPTTFTITHGLSVAPSLSDIQLTLLSGIGTAANFWPGAAGGTTFTITFNAAPGASVSVGWKINEFMG